MSTAFPPRAPRAEASSACLRSTARAGAPSCTRADCSRAAAPAICGAAMLVPPAISSPRFHGGTLEKAIPGAQRSGLASSPPRALKSAIPSASTANPCGRPPLNTPGNKAQTDRMWSAEPGNPTVEMPGPSFPALMTTSTSGCLSANSATRESMAAAPSVSFPTPKLMLMISGRPRCCAKSAV